jgi:hypothetical protein
LCSEFHILRSAAIPGGSSFFFAAVRFLFVCGSCAAGMPHLLPFGCKVTVFLGRNAKNPQMPKLSLDYLHLFTFFCLPSHQA